MCLTSEQIESLFAEVKTASAMDDKELIWTRLNTLLRAQSTQRDAAEALLKIVEKGCLLPDRGLEIFEAVEAAYPDDEGFLVRIGEHFAQAVDINFLNAPPPTTELASRLIDKLQKLAREKRGTADENVVLDALSAAARISGRSYDAVAEPAYRRLVEIEPDVSRHRYNFGLFLKTRGRFAEGMTENRIARALSESSIDRHEWNFGICATGAGEGEAALGVWKELGQIIEMGRFELPEGRYPSCKVKLAERPLAERSATSDTPGDEETVWIERLSPCHGIVRSVLFQALGVDFGDVILFDGAPITYHKYGERNVPVFPHLATLLRRNYQFFDFAGTQSDTGQLADLTEKLTGDAVIYSHSENFEILCMDCWSDVNVDHIHSNNRELNVVTGRIAASASVKAGDLLHEIDVALSGDKACRIFSPDLCEAAGLHERAKFERRRFEQLAGS